MQKQQFIPISSKQIIKDLCFKNPEFLKLFNLLTASYQYSFSKKLSNIKENYQSFDPDCDLIKSNISSDKNIFLDDMEKLLVNANYKQLKIVEIENFISEQMQSGLNIEIDLSDFEILKIYKRGVKYKTISFFNWSKLKKQQQKLTIFQRVVFIIKIKSLDDKLKNIKGKKIVKKTIKAYKKLPQDMKDNFIFIKLFKNIASSDLEMLFPNRKIKLKTLDKVRLSATSSVGTIMGIVSATGKIIAASTNIFGVIIAIGGFIGILFKQIMGIVNKRTQYMATLSSQLYFHNLDNNFGAITNITDSGLEQEIKEIVLAYYFLSIANKPLTSKELDLTIEKYLFKKYSCDIDFEVSDALQKLKNDNLLNNLTTEFEVKNINDSYSIIDKKWDNLF